MPLKLSQLVDKYVVEVYAELHAAADAGRVDDFTKIAVDMGELNREIQKLCDERDQLMFAFYNKLALEWNRVIKTKLAEKTPDLFTPPKDISTAKVTVPPKDVFTAPTQIQNAEPSFDALPPAAVAQVNETSAAPITETLQPAKFAAPLLPSSVPMTPPTVVLPSPVSATPPQVVPNAPESPAVQPTALKTICSKDFWACDNEKCGSDDLEFRLSIMTVRQATDSAYVDYVCRACGFKHGAMLQRDEISALAELEGSFVNPVTGAAAPAPAATTAPKKGRAKKSSAAPAEGKADAKTFQVVTTKGPAEINAIVQSVIKDSEKEIASDTLLETFRTQVAKWELEKLVKEWEQMTGKTYAAGTTVPATMAEDVVRQMAGLPVATQ